MRGPGEQLELTVETIQERNKGPRREEKRRETREDLLPKTAKEVEQDGTLGATENSFQRKSRWSKGGRSSMKKAHLSTC